MAFVIGALFGALECASGTAVGSGHGGHPMPVASHAAHTSGHGEHHSVTGTEATDADRQASAPSDADAPGGAVAQGHPGMACLTSVRLRVPDLAVFADARSRTETPTPPPGDCILEPDPPVPRSS